MTDDSPKAGKIPTVKIHDRLDPIEVVDPHGVQPLYADAIAEIRMIHGVLHVTLASLIMEGVEPIRKAQVCARLRISPDALAVLLNSLAPPAQPTAGDTIN